uniref:Genome polyprotein n=1 Tax=Pomacentrus nagasakiensis picornavirus TaxID=3156509 RepID=A0AAU7BB43_9VIRU
MTMEVSSALGGLAKRSLGLFGLADHGTELDTSQSDRLMMTGAGNTTMITQRAVAPTIMGQSLPEKFRSALDLPASKETITEKGYVVALGTWTADEKEGQVVASVNFPHALLLSDFAINGILQYHEYIRFGLEVTLQINPTEWQMGGLVMWIEACEDSAAIGKTSFNNLLTYASGIVNCNVNNEVTIKQAFTYSRNYYQMHQASKQPEVPFMVRVYVWSQMRVNTGTSRNVSFKITANLCDVEIHGMRPQAVQMYRMRPAHDYRPTREIMIGPGVGMLNASNQQELKVNAHLTLGCEGFEQDATPAGGIECTDWTHHLETPCRFNTFQWSTTSPAGTLLLKFKVHPRQPTNTYDTWSPSKCTTNQALISSLYRFWRGDLVFLFQVFATKWHSGRIMVAFTPGQTEVITATTDLKKVSTCNAAYYDIHGPQSTFAYRVPYISSTQYMDTDPTNGFIGYVYVFVYTQMAAPSTVSTDVEVVCLMSAGDNFELFVPSYNAVQVGGEEVQNVDAVKDQVEKVKETTPEPKPAGESPAGALEMPQFDSDKVGTFPTLKEGRRLHSQSHTDLANLLGRAHHLVSFTYSSAQSFINDYAINWNTMPGYLGAIAKCFTLFRGGLKLVVIVETTWQAELYMCFRPTGDESIRTLEQMYKYGMVSISSDQTNQLVLKLPWYQPLAANSIWSTTDGLFGYVTLAGSTSGTVKIHYALAFDSDSKFYVPRGCPAVQFWQPSTQNSAYRQRRSLPDHYSDNPKSTKKVDPKMAGAVRVLPEETPNEFVRSSMDRKAGFDRSLSLDTGLDLEYKPDKHHDKVVTRVEKAMTRLFGAPRDPLTETMEELDELPLGPIQRPGPAPPAPVVLRPDPTRQQEPQMSAEGPWLCKRKSEDYPIDHYFLVLRSGRQFGFHQPDRALSGPGFVAEEFNRDFEVVEAAEEIAELVVDLVGRYHRDYNVASFNCEHWARSHAGLEEKSTQSAIILGWLGVVPAAFFATFKGMVEQMGEEIEMSETAQSQKQNWFRWCRDIFDQYVPEPTELDLQKVDYYLQITWAMYGKMGRPELERCWLAWVRHAWRMREQMNDPGEGSSGLSKIYVNSMEDVENEWVASIEARKNEKKKSFVDSIKTAVVDKISNKVVKVTTPKIEKVAETLEHEAQATAVRWVKEHIQKMLSTKGAKIVGKVMTILTDFCQAMCLLNVCVNYPVPGVVGPIGLAATLGVMRGGVRLLNKLTTMKEEAEDDLTDELGTMLYELLINEVPEEMHPQMGLPGFLLTLRDINIMSSAVRNLTTLGKWCVDAAKKCVDYIFPTENRKAVDALNDASREVQAILLLAEAYKADVQYHPRAEDLEFLAMQTASYWIKAKQAKSLLKDPTLDTQLLRAYGVFKDCITRAKYSGDGLPRVEPVVVWLHGAKGSGKTLAALALAAKFCAVKGWDPRKEIYSKPVGADYYDGYNQQNIMIMDDVGQASDAGDFDDFCQLVSSSPLRLNMAHLDEKGMTFKTPLIIASSNLADPQPNNLVHKDALTRRIADHRYYVRVHDAYRKRSESAKEVMDPITGKNTPDHVLDAAKAKSDGMLRTMECCGFYHGVVPKVGAQKYSLQEIFRSVSKALKTRAQMHKDLLGEWFDFVEQGKKVTNEKEQSRNVFKKLVEEAGIAWPQEKKVTPTWIRVLAGVALALGAIATLTGVAMTLHAVAQKAKPQGAYNAVPTNRAVVVPRQAVPLEQSVSDVVGLVRGNLVSVGYRKHETITHRLQGLFVNELTLLVPSHLLTVMGHHDLVIVSREVEYIYNYSDLSIHPLKWGPKETDAVLIHLPTGGATPYRDIRNHFVSAESVELFEGSSGVLVTYGTHGLTYVPEKDLQFHTETKYGTTVIYNPAGVFIGRGATMDGMCGGALVSSVNKYQNPILGIHVAGNGSMATTQVITKEMLHGHREQVGKIVKIRDCEPVGCSSKTQFVLSPLAPYFNSGKMPAKLAPTAQTEQDIFAQAISKYSGDIRERPQDWEEFERAFTHRVLRLCDLDGLEDRAVCGLNIKEAINGTEGLDRIALSTSPGYPWVTLQMRKKDLVEWNGKEWLPTPTLKHAVYSHIEEVEEDVEGFDELLEDLEDVNKQAGWDPPIRYVTYYKDELRDKEKVMSGKTRIIEAAPVHHVVAFRMRFGYAMARLHELNIQKGFAPGCDIEVQARYLWYMMQKMRSLVDADYSNFDGSLQPFQLYSAMRVLGAVQGVDPVTANRWGRLLVRSDHMFGSTLVSVFGGMPSGSPATTVVNTLCNLMMTYYVLGKIYKEPVCNLVLQHRCVAYGDDLLICSRDPDLEQHMVRFVTLMDRYFGATMTAADKNGAPKACHITEVRFLKRRFEMRGSKVYACLDLSTIESMFEYQRSDETFQDRCVDALRFAWHHGMTVFSHFSHRLGRACHAAGVECPIVDADAVAVRHSERTVRS